MAAGREPVPPNSEIDELKVEPDRLKKSPGSACRGGVVADRRGGAEA